MTVGTALLTSLALALTWTPTLSHYLLRRKGRENASKSADAHGHVRPHGFMGRVMRVYVSTLRLVLARPLVLAVGCVVLIGASYFCYTHLGSDLLPGNGRRRLHSRLPDARGIVARRHQSGLARRREDSQGDSGGGEHVAPHRLAAWSRRRYRSEYRRFFGQAEARPQARHRRSDFRYSRQGQRRISAARRRIHSGAAGHDRRPDQFARADRDQTVPADPGAAENMGAEGRRQDQEDQRRQGRQERHREYHQRLGHRDECRSRRGRALRLHAAGNRAGRERDSAGRARAHAGDCQRSLLHDSRALSRKARALRSMRSAIR